jgi:hypothetical protein
MVGRGLREGCGNCGKRGVGVVKRGARCSKVGDAPRRVVSVLEFGPEECWKEALFGVGLGTGCG